MKDLSLRSFQYKSKIHRYRAESGVLRVPENRSSLNPRLISLPVKRIYAQNQTPAEPIFYLGGGPGVSNMRFEPPDALLAKHDIVMVGYRGVDGSTVLDCPEVSKAMYGDGRDILNDESLGMIVEAMRRCRARLEAAGVDLNAYTIQAVVEDLDAARVALGYRQINLLSESYGTRVAQIYAGLHPASLYRSVMIGVNPPGRFVWEPGIVDEQIEQYSRLWAQDAALRTRAGDLASAMRKVSHAMPPRWLVFPIDPGKVNAVAFVLLFNRKPAATVFDAYVAAAQGDPSGLALMSLAYDFFMPKSVVWGDLFAKGGSADFDPGRDYCSTLRPPESIIGSPLSLLIWAPLSQAWEFETLPAELRQAQPTEVETLLVSGSIDFSTPAEYATHELLPCLKNGRQVVLSELGHVGDVWSVQPEATQRLLTSFYETGDADDSLYQYAPMDFKVKYGFPFLAKFLLITGVLFVLKFYAWMKRRRKDL